MKFTQIIFIIAFLFFSCKSKEQKDDNLKISAVDSSAVIPEHQSFFPVTEFIKGQVYEIKNGGVNPMKYITVHGHTDSAWLKMEDLNKEVADFLSPEIDTSNLLSLFSEKKFIDQTLDAITFTYDPIKTLPDTFAFQHWNVYVDPAKNNVRSVYLVKKLPGNKTELLTWQSGKSCNIKTVSSDSSGNVIIDKEITIKWHF